MNPLHLTLENFFCHVNSDIDLSGFSSALIVGKGINNDQRSNGVGKSKIFTAIDYVLFNEIKDIKSIENIIRDGSDTCKVTFIFENDNVTYKVVRSRGRKANSAELNLYIKNQNGWDKKTERRNEDTERELSKIIRLNYKTFHHSAMFAQNDLEGLPSLTPEKRKQVLKDCLQLHPYTKMELIAKKKLAGIDKNIQQKQTLIESFRNIEQTILDLSEQEKNANSSKLDLQNNIATQKHSVKEKQKSLQELVQANLQFKMTAEQLNNKILSLDKSIQKLTASKNNLIEHLNSIKKDIETDIQTITDQTQQIQNIKANILDGDQISKIQQEAIAAHSNLKVEFKVLDSELSRLLVPLPTGTVCGVCRHELTPEHLQACAADIAKNIESIREKKDSTDKKILELQKQINLTNSQLNSISNDSKRISSLEMSIATKEKNIAGSRSLFDNYKSQLKQTKETLADHTEQYELARTDLLNFNSDAYNKAVDDISSLKAQITSEETSLLSYENKYNQVCSTVSVIQDRLSAAMQSQANSLIIKEELKKEEKNCKLYNKVVTAFGSKGIPTLIIHNMLDDLQIEANIILEQIKPGLQLKFEIDKENSKGETSDTLSIMYFINGRDREYGQLSGGQKLIIILSLRLALSVIIQRNLGLDIRFLMLDEVDPSLDKESLQLFHEMIKYLEKSFKILIITHNDSLKDKFEHAILVEQDQDMNSTARMVQSW